MFGREKVTKKIQNNNSKCIWPQVMRSCFSLCLSLAFLANSFLPVYSITKNKNYLPENITYDNLSHIAYAYKTVLNKDIPRNEEIYELANKIYSNKEEINIPTAQKYLEEKIKSNLTLKSALTQDAYKNKFRVDLPEGTALTLSNTLLAHNNSYSSIYKALGTQYLAQVDGSTPQDPEPQVNNNNTNLLNCDVLDLELLDLYKASPQTKAKLNDPFKSVTLSLLSGSQTKLSELDHSLQNHKLAWNLLGYPTSFGLTYNADGKFINVTVGAAAIQNLVGVASDAIQTGGEITFGGFLPISRFNSLGDEYYTVGADPKGKEGRPYLYAFDISANQGTFTRAKETFTNHYSGLSCGLDITPNGNLLIGVEDGNLTAILKTQSKSPITVKDFVQVNEFTKKYTNYFEVDESTWNNSSLALGIAGYVLPDTYKYSDLLSLLQKNTNQSNQFGFTIFAANQEDSNQNNIKISSKLDFWGNDLDKLLGFKNVTIAGYKIKNNQLYISYYLNNGINFKKFYEDNYKKYSQEGKNWINPETGLPPSAFNYKDGLFDTRLAVFKLDINNNSIQLQRISDISTVFDSPTCSGQSYGVSGPIEVSNNFIFIADKNYTNVIRAFKFDPLSVLGIVPSSKPFVIRLDNPRIEKVLNDSKYKPLGNDFAFSTTISDITINPDSSILFVSLPYLETIQGNLDTVHINGFLASVYLTSSKESCSKITSSQSCKGNITEEENEIDRNKAKRGYKVDESEQEKNKGKEQTLRYLSIADGPVTPTVVLDTAVAPAGFNQPLFNRGFHFAELDVTTDAKSPNDIRVSLGARGVNWVSLIQLKPTDPGDIFYPLIKQDKILFKDKLDYSDRDGINTYGKSTTLLARGNKISALSIDNKVNSGDISDASISPTELNIDNVNPTLISKLPSSDKVFVVLDTPPDALQADSNNVVYVFADKNKDPLVVKNGQGKITDQSFSIPGVFGLPFNIKYKSNELFISDAQNKNNPQEFIALSYYNHNLKSKASKYYLNDITTSIPDFIESSPDNLSNFLKTFQGFSLFTVLNEDASQKKSQSDTRTFKNFYFDNLPAQLQSPSLDVQRFIAGATLFQNPKTNDLYLAVSSYDTEPTDPALVFSQPSPIEQKGSSGSGVAIASSGSPLASSGTQVQASSGIPGSSGIPKGTSSGGIQKGTKTQAPPPQLPAVDTDGLLTWFDAINVNGKGKTAKDASSLILLTWTDLSNTGYKGSLININPRTSWVGDGSYSNPFALKLPGTPGAVQIDSAALDKIRDINSYTFEAVFKLDPSHEGYSGIFSRGTDQRLLIDRNNNIFINADSDDINTNIKVSTNEWHHIALTKTNLNDANIYLDGKLVFSAKKGKVIDRTQTTYIGSGEEAAGHFFKGSIACFRAYSRALTETDVLKNYNAELPRFTNTGTTSTSSETTSVTEEETVQTEGIISSPDSGWNGSNSPLSPSALICDGVNDYAKVTSTGITGNSPRTISTWVKVLKYEYPKGIWSIGADANGYPLYLRLDNNAGKLFVGSNGQNNNIQLTIPSNVNGWHNITLTYDGNEVKGFVDAQLNGSFTATLNSVTSEINIGRYADSIFNYSANVAIANVRVYNFALNADQVKQNYNAEANKFQSNVPSTSAKLIADGLALNLDASNVSGTDDYASSLTTKDIWADLSGNKKNAALFNFKRPAGSSASQVTSSPVPPVLQDISIATSYGVGQSVIFTVGATDDNPGDKITIKADSLPAWADFDYDPFKAQGIFLGTPDAPGTFNVTFTAFDNSGLKSTPKTVSIIINKPKAGDENAPPVVTNPGNITITDNKPTSFNIAATSPSGRKLTWEIYLPPNLVIDKNTGVVSGTPLNAAGSYTSRDYAVYVTVVDSKGLRSEQTKFTLTIVAGNRPPVITSKADEILDDNDTVSFTVSAKDPDGDPVKFVITEGHSLPPGLKFNDQLGIFSGTLDHVVEYTYKDFNVYPITLHAEDGKQINSKSEDISFKIIVLDSNHTPIIKNPGDQTFINNPEGTQGQYPRSSTFKIEFSDPDPDDNVKLVIDGLPSANDGFYNYGNGTIYGTPIGVCEKYNRSPITYPITAYATDGKKVSGNSERINFNITVTDPNHSPILERPLDKEVKENERFTIQLKAQDQDYYDQITYKAKGLPEGVSIDGKTGLISGATGYLSDQTGIETNIVKVTVYADDGHKFNNKSEEYTFNLTVQASNRPPKINPIDNQKVTVNNDFTIQLSAIDPDNDTIYYSSTVNPFDENFTNNVTFDNRTGRFSGRLPIEGTWTVSAYAYDRHAIRNKSDTITFNITSIKGTALRKYDYYNMLCVLEENNDLNSSKKLLTRVIKAVGGNKNSEITRDVRELLSKIKITNPKTEVTHTTSQCTIHNSLYTINNSLITSPEPQGTNSQVTALSSQLYLDGASFESKQISTFDFNRSDLILAQSSSTTSSSSSGASSGASSSGASSSGASSSGASSSGASSTSTSSTSTSSTSTSSTSGTTGTVSPVSVPGCPFGTIDCNGTCCTGGCCAGQAGVCAGTDACNQASTTTTDKETSTTGTTPTTTSGTGKETVSEKGCTTKTCDRTCCKSVYACCENNESLCANDLNCKTTTNGSCYHDGQCKSNSCDLVTKTCNPSGSKKKQKKVECKFETEVQQANDQGGGGGGFGGGGLGGGGFGGIGGFGGGGFPSAGQAGGGAGLIPTPGGGGFPGTGQAGGQAGSIPTTPGGFSGGTPGGIPGGSIPSGGFGGYSGFTPPTSFGGSTQSQGSFGGYTGPKSRVLRNQFFGGGGFSANQGGNQGNNSSSDDDDDGGSNFVGQFTFGNSGPFACGSCKDKKSLAGKKDCYKCSACQHECDFDGDDDNDNLCDVCCPPENIPEEEKLIFYVSAENIDGKGSNANIGALNKILTWTNLTNTSDGASLNSYTFSGLDNWVGNGTVKKPYTLGLDGVKTYLRIGSQITDPIRLTNAYSLSGWIYLDIGHTDIDTIFTRRKEINLAINSNSNILVNGEDTKVNLKTNTWYHFALVRYPTNVGKLFLNGAPVWITKKLLYIKDKPSDSFIGAKEIEETVYNYGQGGNQTVKKYIDTFRGKIAEFRIYKTELSDEKVGELFKKDQNKYLVDTSNQQPSLANCGINFNGKTNYAELADYNAGNKPYIDKSDWTISTRVQVFSETKTPLQENGAVIITDPSYDYKGGGENSNSNFYGGFGGGGFYGGFEQEDNSAVLTLLTIGGKAAILQDGKKKVGAIGKTNIIDGEYHNIAGVRRGTHYEIYVDGVLEGVDSYTNSSGAFPTEPYKFQSDSKYQVGRHSGWTGHYSNISVNYIRMYNKALSTDELLEETKKPPTEVPASLLINLAGYWKFFETESNPIVGYKYYNDDLSPDRIYNGELHGNNFTNCDLKLFRDPTKKTIVKENLSLYLDASNIDGRSLLAKTARINKTDTWTDLSRITDRNDVELKNFNWDEKGNWVGNGTIANQYALRFNGYGNYVEKNNAPQVFIGGQQYYNVVSYPLPRLRSKIGTIEAWVKVNDFKSGEIQTYIISLSRFGKDDHLGITTGYPYGNRFGIRYRNTEPNGRKPLFVAYTASEFETNKWYHIAFVVNEGNHVFYVNGKPQSLFYETGDSSDNYFLDTLQPDLLRIGNLKRGSKESYFFDGEISKIRIYGIALKPKQITSNFLVELPQFSTDTSSSTEDLESFSLDSIPPGIKTDTGTGTGLATGETFSAFVIDEGRGSPQGSNPTHDIAKVSCNVGFSNAPLNKSEDVPVVKSGLTFDRAKNQKVTIPLGGELTEWTIAALVKRAIVTEKDYYGKSSEEFILKTSEGHGLAIFDNKLALDPNTYHLLSKASLDANQWYYVVATCDGLTIKLYINGELDNSFDPFIFNLNQSGYTLGTTIGDDNDNIFTTINKTFAGSISQLLFFNRAQKADEVKVNNRYRLEPTDPRGLIGWWKFNEISGLLTNGYKWSKKYGIIQDPSINGTLVGFSPTEECKIDENNKAYSGAAHLSGNTFGVTDKCKNCINRASFSSYANNTKKESICDICKKGCGDDCGLDTCDFCCGVSLSKAKYTYPGRQEEYKYNLKEYKFEIPEFPPGTTDQTQRISCSVSDIIPNEVKDEYLGDVLVFNRPKPKTIESFCCKGFTKLQASGSCQEGFKLSTCTTTKVVESTSTNSTNNGPCIPEQWASDATARSEYYPAIKAIGPPDCECPIGEGVGYCYKDIANKYPYSCLCETVNSAWVTQHGPDTPDPIDVKFAKPSIANQIIIREAYSLGRVVKVTLFDTNNDPLVVFDTSSLNSKDDTTCSNRDLSISFPQTSTPISHAQIQTDSYAFAGIDAVELICPTKQSTSKGPQATTATEYGCCPISSSGGIKTSSSSSGELSEGKHFCAQCDNGFLKLDKGKAAVCFKGRVDCAEDTLVCCRGPRCLQRDPTLGCVDEKFIEEAEQNPEEFLPIIIGRGGTPKKPKGTSTSSSGGKPNFAAFEDADSYSDIGSGGIVTPSPENFVSSGFLITKSNDNPIIKSGGIKGQSKFFKQVSCNTFKGKQFVVKNAFDFYTSIPQSQIYTNSKLTIYKVEQAGNSFSLKLVTEQDTSELLSDECTSPTRAAVAGPVIYDDKTKELVVSDTNGVNIAKIYKVNFDTPSPVDLSLELKGKLNISSVYDGYISDSAITSSYGKSHYLLFAKVNEKNYNHSLALIPVPEVKDLDFNTSSDQKGQSTKEGLNNQGQAGNAGNNPLANLIDPVTGKPINIFISAGGGLLNAGSNLNPFGDSGKKDTEVKGDEGRKPEDALDITKGDNKGKKEEKSSSSSGKMESSSSSSSGGKSQEECLQTSDCLKNASLFDVGNYFCIEINNKGKCISNVYEKISRNGKIKNGPCREEEISIQGRKKEEHFCVPTTLLLDSGISPTLPDSRLNRSFTQPNQNLPFLPPANSPPQELPNIQPQGIPPPDTQSQPLKPTSINNDPRFFFGNQKETNLSTKPNSNLYIDGAYWDSKLDFNANDLINVQDRTSNNCKNFTDCNYNQGDFCISPSITSNTGICKFVCQNGKVALGLDLSGASLPCPSNFSDSGLIDLSGRKVCCPSQTNKGDKGLNQISLTGSKFCTKSSDCKKNQFCAYLLPTNLTSCADFNCEGARVVTESCNLDEIRLASGPEGIFCCPLVYSGGTSSSSSSSGGSSSSSSSGGEASSSSSSGGVSSSSSGGVSSSSSGGEKASSSSSSSGGKASSSSSSSSGGKPSSSSSSSSGGYSIILVLQTPEIFSPTLKARQANLKAEVIQPNINIQQSTTLGQNTNIQAVPQGQAQAEVFHTYESGKKINFTVSIKGPPGAKPQDISSYTITATAKQKSVGTSRDSYLASLKLFAISPKDILASSDISNFFNNAPPLTLSLIREDENGNFTSAIGSIFNLKLPDLRYFANNLGKLQLPTLTELGRAGPENKCSSKGDKTCGLDVISIGTCLCYQCFRFSKGSQLAKDCCKGFIPIAPSYEISSSSSGGPTEIPKPTCNKDTNSPECKSTNVYLIAHCNNRNIPECSSEGKPICKPISGGSSGIPVNEEPKCVSVQESTELYCKDVSTLTYNSNFDSARCVSEYCDYLKNPEEKKGCCAACGAIYDKLTTSKGTDSYEEEKIKSCLDFSGGPCGFKRADTCVYENCSKLDLGSDELNTCCLKYDKEAAKINQILKEAKTQEDSGNVYNIIAVSDSEKQGPLKIQKTDELIAQNFELTLPTDPQIGQIWLKAAIKDKKGKTKDADLKIALVPGHFEEEQKDKTTTAEEGKGTSKEKASCIEPTISSLKVADGGTLPAFKNEPIEIPIIAIGKSLGQLKITGLSQDFNIQEITKDPTYNYTSIKGIPKTLGKTNQITASVDEKCGKSNKLRFDILVFESPTETNVETTEGKGIENIEQPAEAPKKLGIDKSGEITGALEGGIEAQTFSKSWLPKLPVITLGTLANAKKGTPINIKVEPINTLVAGSKIPIELYSKINALGLNPANLKIRWISSQGKTTLIPAPIKILNEKTIRLVLSIDNSEPEGAAKIIISSANDDNNIIAESAINIKKPQSVSSIFSKKGFGPPTITKIASTLDPTNKQIVQLTITGKNFIGKRAKINNIKVAVPKKNTFGVKRLTIAEFRNNNIVILSTLTQKENTELIVRIKLPKDYKGGTEELFISTPVGQTFTEVLLPPVK